ncbi:hypothetical protein Mal4_02160 [Maioricimonas rarisocia]|uniref:Zinc-finger domain-containing protein n=1 Tax=Maioricimonas rarisocia TaxID=2528026 RepID=A0A517Z0C2_9PLAN|nr:hypothetical protein [Maioricimonas rarisocia]QDU35934.1 hypothetical protein Mal4_02160 [Maioricimonas rarisocia]
MMTCDDAFDALTSADRRTSPELAAHLAGCPRCRQMQETLAPALDLFEQEEPQSAAVSSPSPVLTPEAVQLAEATALTLQSNRVSKPRLQSRKPLTWLRYCAATVAGAAIVWLAGDALTPMSAGGGGNSAQACLWKNPDALPERDQQRPHVVISSCVSCHLAASSGR